MSVAAWKGVTLLSGAPAICGSSMWSDGSSKWVQACVLCERGGLGVH